MKDLFMSVVEHFNSQPHKEADHFPMFKSCFTFIISTHSLTRRLTVTRIYVQTCFCISTHSLTRRLTPFRDCFEYTKQISTHSLTRRLTRFPNSFARSELISTHSLTRRLTVLFSVNKKRNTFQLTASQGG